MNINGELSARITPDMFAFLEHRGQKANIKALRQAVNRLCLAATQKNGGHSGPPDKYVNLAGPEIDMLHFIILAEAVALVLSGKLDELEDEVID